MKKAILILLVFSIVFLAGCKEKVLETGPKTSCTTDDDCWCRSFTGAGFVEGKGPSRCCTEELQKNFAGTYQQDWCPTVNVCMQCTYK